MLKLIFRILLIVLLVCVIITISVYCSTNAKSVQTTFEIVGYAEQQISTYTDQSTCQHEWKFDWIDADAYEVCYKCSKCGICAIENYTYAGKGTQVIVRK